MRRILAVITIVAALGAVGGAIGGVAIAGIISLLAPDPSQTVVDLSFWAIARATGAFGAVVGAILGPVYGWTLLRRAPLWRAVAESAFAAALGTGIAFALIDNLAVWIGASVASSLAAALRLRAETLRALPSARHQLTTLGD